MRLISFSAASSPEIAWTFSPFCAAKSPASSIVPRTTTRSPVRRAPSSRGMPDGSLTVTSAQAPRPIGTPPTGTPTERRRAVD
jgi:hypothetical protein